jgi:hypothetical protein
MHWSFHHVFHTGLDAPNEEGMGIYALRTGLDAAYKRKYMFLPYQEAERDARITLQNPRLAKLGKYVASMCRSENNLACACTILAFFLIRRCFV